MKPRRHPTGAAILAATLLTMARPAAAQWCGAFNLTMFLPADQDLRIQATALGERVKDRFAGLFPREYQQGDLARAFGYDHFIPGPAEAQLIRIDRGELAGSDWQIEDSVAVLVRWVGPTERCRLNPAQDRLGSGTRHLFIARLRPESLWVASRPTLDVLPGPFNAITIDSTPPAPTSPPDYLSLIHLLPSREEWELDCRPATLRVTRWIDTWLSHAPSHPLQQARWRLSQVCTRLLEQRAASLLRSEASMPVPAAVRAVYRRQACRTDHSVLTSVTDAVNGRFTSSTAPQWAFICQRLKDWRLLVVVMESPVRIIELVRMAGKEWSWKMEVAPAQLFEWTSAEEFSRSRMRAVPRPARDVVLLKSLSGVPDQPLAFYETATGWIHVRVKCCRWPE